MDSSGWQAKSSGLFLMLKLGELFNSNDLFLKSGTEKMGETEVIH